MKEVIGINFNENGRLYYFNPNGLVVSKGDKVIVETERGIQYGFADTDITKIQNDQISNSLKKVLRIATAEDKIKYDSNIKEAAKALSICKKLIEKHKLNMQLIDASFTFNREQLLFHFLSDNRIDFRDLVKELAGIYKTRIELRQVGVRDKAKEIGGLGPCGMILCCNKFLNIFDSVSINMAKNQNLSLNPAKINGACGRLLCCLNYEDEVYMEHRKDLPDIGERITKKGKEGRVIDLNILKRTYTILTQDNETITFNYDEK